MDINNILKHYLIAMLWTDEELDEYSIEDIDQGTIDKAKLDIESFIGKAKHLLNEWTEEQIGHDFWLTRKEHGAGFWDRDHLPNTKKITEICQAYVSHGNTFAQDGKVFYE